ncbi:MAG: GDCCVxC domain-containing (seleno)protein [Nitrospinales bacterium]
MTEIITQSTLTCPYCGMSRTETMPTDSCLFFYDCNGCLEVLQPKDGHCCVFCTYGNVPCPSMQKGDCGK